VVPLAVARAVSWVGRGALRVLTGLAAMTLAIGVGLAGAAQASDPPTPTTPPAVAAETQATETQAAEAQPTQATDVDEPAQQRSAIGAAAPIRVGTPSTVYTGHLISGERGSSLGQRAPPRG
jgi:hypothetical protein